MPYRPRRRRQLSHSDDKLFMAFCKLEARKSTETTKVGACVVDSRGNIFKTAYSKTRPGRDEHDGLVLSTKQNIGLSDHRHLYDGHAEMNAIIDGMAEGIMGNGSIYSTHFPCEECAEVIILGGIKEVVYFDYGNIDKNICVKIKKLMKCAGIKCRKFSPD